MPADGKWVLNWLLRG